MRVETWRKIALALYIPAGLCFAVACGAYSAVHANVLAVQAMHKKLDDVVLADQAKMADALSAKAVSTPQALPLERDAPVADWPRTLPSLLPSVVAVYTIDAPQGHAGNNRLWIIPGVHRSLYTDLLNRWMAKADGWAKSDEALTWQIEGAGVLVRDGLRVLTVGHVVNGAQSVRVKLASGSWRAAHLVGASYADDVAELRIEGAPGQPVKMAKSMPRQGQAVLMVGSADGYGFAASSGIVARYGFDGRMLHSAPFMMVSAPAWPGDSGGVVVNSKGEALSLVSYGQGDFTQTIPIDRAMAVATILERHNK